MKSNNDTRIVVKIMIYEFYQKRICNEYFKYCTEKSDKIIMWVCTYNIV